MLRESRDPNKKKKRLMANCGKRLNNSSRKSENMEELHEFPVFVEETQSVITLLLTQEVINKVQTGNI